jgi:alpha-ribazole phosphatase/probable phosphoglycerate mutase
MNEPTTVWLIRHSAPAGAEGLCYGRHDVPLSEDGRLQAKKLAEQFASETMDAIYASPLRRAMDTAQILAERRGLAIETCDDLAEIDFGEFEGRSYQEIEALFPEAFQMWMREPTQVRFPQGENFQDLRRRSLRALDFILARHAGQKIVIVSHAGVIRVLLAQALGIPDAHVFRLDQDYGSLNRIDYFDHGPLVRLINGASVAKKEVLL